MNYEITAEEVAQRFTKSIQLLLEWNEQADDIETIYLSKVRGGLKLWHLYDALKLL